MSYPRNNCPKHPLRMAQEGAYRWCEECAWEDPSNPKEPPKEPPKEGRMDVESLGTKELHKLCSTRIREIEEALAESERRHREKVAGAKAELSKLRRIVAFCEGGGSGGARPNTGPKQPGASLGTCPDCGFKTSNRWMRRHRETECPQRKTA
jgi:hypothetical protein